MKNSHIIPTVFSHNRRGFETRFRKINAISGKIHIDFMDGKFVRAKSVALKDIQSLKKYRKEFEAHLMVKNPEDWFLGCKEKGFRRVIFHVEACKGTKDPETMAACAKKLGLQVYVAVNPSTPLRKIARLVKNRKVDGVLVMGVRPGEEGQKMSPRIPERIRKIKKLNKRILVHVDGGINAKDVESVSRAGADEVNSGSFIADAKQPKKQMELLEKLFEAGKR